MCPGTSHLAKSFETDIFGVPYQWTHHPPFAQRKLRIVIATSPAFTSSINLITNSWICHLLTSCGLLWSKVPTTLVEPFLQLVLLLQSCHSPICSPCCCQVELSEITYLMRSVSASNHLLLLSAIRRMSELLKDTYKDLQDETLSCLHFQPPFLETTY